MQTKTIVVHLENADLCPARLATAVDMASRHGAHLTGLFLSIEEFDGDVYGRSRGRGLRGARQDRLASDQRRRRRTSRQPAALPGSLPTASPPKSVRMSTIWRFTPGRRIC